MVTTLGILLIIRIKIKVFLILIPVAVLAAWILIPLFLLSFILKFLRVKNLEKEEVQKLTKPIKMKGS